MDIRIESLQPEYKPALEAFLQKCYSDSPLKADANYLQWRFAGDPRGSSREYYFVALDGERIVGQWCGIVDRVWVEGQWHDALWLVDLMIDPEYRRTSTLLGLAKAAMTCGKLCLAVGADEPIVPLYDALRWRRLQAMETYYAALKPSRLARLAISTGRKMPGGALMWPALHAADFLTPSTWRARLAVCTSTKDVVVEAAPEIDAHWDDWIVRQTTESERTTERSAAILDWKFSKRPVGTHFTLLARDTNTSQPRGYMIAKVMQRHDIRWVEIADFLVAPGDDIALAQLTNKAVDKALRYNADFLRVRCGLPQHQRVFRRGWWIHKTTPVVDEVFAFSTDKSLLDALSGGPWHLTGLVSDRVDYGRDDWTDGAR